MQNSFFKNSIRFAFVVTLIAGIISCDVTSNDNEPDFPVRNIDLFKVPGAKTAINLGHALSDLNIADIVTNDGSVVYDKFENLLVYDPAGSEDQSFQFEILTTSDDKVFGNVTIREQSETEDGIAENFTHAVISNKSVLTVDMLKNEDFKGLGDNISSGAIVAPFDLIEGQEANYEVSKMRLSGAEEFVTYTLDPKDDFVGEIRIEYIIALQLDNSEDYTTQDYLDNPELSEFYSRHVATIEVVDGRDN